MAREVVKKELDGHQYTIGQWPVQKSLRMFTRLTKLLGEPIAAFVMGAQASPGETKSFMDKDLSSDTIAKAVHTLAERLDEELVVRTFEEITSEILCDGKPVVFNVHFMGRIGHLFKVSIAVLRVQYSDFLDELPAAAAYRQANGEAVSTPAN